MSEASTFGVAFDKLPHDTQRGIIRQLQIRKKQYMQALSGIYPGTTRIVIIGDKPGPGRPKAPGLNHDPSFHHTPFYSTKNCSLWLNQLLVEAMIDERELLWFNAEMADGSELPLKLARDLHDKLFIALGNNAEMWIRRNASASECIKVHHPQFAKRFKSKEPYALINVLKEAL